CRTSAASTRPQSTSQNQSLNRRRYGSSEAGPNVPSLHFVLRSASRDRRRSRTGASGRVSVWAMGSPPTVCGGDPAAPRSTLDAARRVDHRLFGVLGLVRSHDEGAWRSPIGESSGG